MIGQTTGMGGHLSARFIPTVERESIDLVDKFVSVWNKELLWVAGTSSDMIAPICTLLFIDLSINCTGYLSRYIYESELTDIKTLWQGAGGGVEPSAEVKTWLVGRGVHVSLATSPGSSNHGRMHA